jgi:glycogen operon protein
MRDFAARVTGSGDIYDIRGRRPWAAVNFVTAHDGFTLNDLVSYNDKHNAANGEDNRDGHADNRSANYGAEGPTDDANIRAVRERQKRNFLGTLLLSHGTPMLLAGDEFGRSQDGNNNAYCQDNAINWVDWEKIGDEGRALADFLRRLTWYRREQPILRRESFRDGLRVSWLNPGGGEQTEEHWADVGANTIGLRLCYPEAPQDSPQWQDVLILYNAHDGTVPFALPGRAGNPWKPIIDTANPEAKSEGLPEGPLELPARSLMLLV